MIVAGIDPSLTATGIAILRDGVPIALDKLGWPGKDGASDHDRVTRVVALLQLVIPYVRRYKPEVIAIEGPSYGSIPLPSTVDRNFLWGLLVHEFAHAGPERYVGVAPKCLKRFVTGNGNASKEMVVAEVRSWWPAERKLKNDNIADAAGLAAMCAAWAGDPLPFELRRVQRESLEVVAWPVIAV